jgi:23S rRNA (guanosine2251-2'-O)-methyltransferase
LEHSDRTQAEGRRAVAEALRAGRPLDRLYVLKEAPGLGALTEEARRAGAVVVLCDRPRLDAMSQTHNHQGIIAVVAAWTYSDLADMLAAARAKGEPPFLVVCDGVEDPGNLGSILRTAEAMGAHGLLLPKRRSAGLSPLTAKASCGALEYLPVARVPGVPSLLRQLKELNIWVYGADAEGAQSVFEADFTGGVALVLGSEGTGLSRLAREECDVLVRIPMRGHVSSLGVAAAAAIAIGACADKRQRTAAQNNQSL